jgi:hypothetical protein
MTAGPAPFLPATFHGSSVVTVGFAWVGEMADARSYLDAFRRRIPTPIGESVEEMRYVDLQRIGDERHHHGLRRYSVGHYLPELSDAAIEAFLARGLPAGTPEPDWSLMPFGGFQAYGGAIAEVGDDESAFSFRRTLVEWFGGATWADPSEDAVRMSAARAWSAAIEPFGTGTYVNVIADTGADVGRAYKTNQLTRLGDLKRKYDPDNVFHLNQNIRPAGPS